MVDTPRGGGALSMQALTIPNAYNVTMRVGYESSQGIVRGDGADWFGPLNPSAPGAPPEVAGRAFDFTSGVNLSTSPRFPEKIGFAEMRTLADSYDLLRLMIETRKDQLCGIKWKIRARPDTDPKTKDQTTPDQQARIEVLTQFFRRPDGENAWRDWLRAILEDKFVIDAVAIYKQRTRGGQLIALKQVDGATIKVILDDWGRTPQPWSQGGKLVIPPAYQQVLKGFPAVNYAARDMVYARYNRRVNKAYGYSEVEQVIMTVNIALRRQIFTLNYYTEGNIPEALLGAPDAWNPQQIAAFQQYWDAMFTGNLAERRRLKIVPGGMGKSYHPTKEPDLKNPLDEWLSRILCFAFNISPQQLVTMMNRATAETSADQSKEDGTEPLKQWISEIINKILADDFNSADLEFVFDDEPEVDPVKQKDVLTAYVKDGIMTIARAQEILGEDPSDDPAANELMVTTAAGRVPIAANTLEAKKEALDLLGPPEAPGGFGGQPGGKGAADGEDDEDDPPPGKPAPKAAEKGHGGHPGHARAGAHPHLRFRKAVARRAITSVPFDWPPLVRAERRIKRLLAKALQKVAAGVAAMVLDEGVTKAKKPKDIADAADLSAIEDIIPDLADLMGDAAERVATEMLARIGVDTEAELVNVVNGAVRRARDIAAELVGRRYNKDGKLVQARRAKYRIDESTRDMIRDLIADGLDENIGVDEIAKNIMEATAFSEERAELIANTEIARVNSEASLESYRGARDEAGVKVKKEWLLAPDPCPICEANNEQGAIDLDDNFQSGDATPPAHPNCRCSVSPVVEDDE